MIVIFIIFYDFKNDWIWIVLGEEGLRMDFELKENIGNKILIWNLK